MFSEVPRGGVDRGGDHFALAGRHGSTRLERRDGELHVVFDERTRPFFQRMPRRISGRIRLVPEARFDHPVAIDAAARHTWWGLAPHARAEVVLDRPGLRFSGPAYHDCNRGEEGLERGFRRWHWSRAELPDGTAVLYDTEDRAGARRELGFLFRADGTIEDFAAPARRDLGRATWGVDRLTRTDPDGRAAVKRTLVASPFYARSVVQTTLGGHEAIGVHESLDCDRFAAGWVRFLLPWRIRRAPRRRLEGAGG